jgi:hypothetical protein
VVAKDRNFQFAHVADKGGEPLEFRFSSVQPFANSVHRRRVFDDKQPQAELLAMLLQNGEGREVPRIVLSERSGMCGARGSAIESRKRADDVVD